MVTKVNDPFPVISDLDGTPLESGYIYIGEPGLDPEAFPKAVFWDAALTTAATQPVRTLAGRFIDLGAQIGNLYTEGDYSILAKDVNLVTVFSAETSSEPNEYYDYFSELIADLETFPAGELIKVVSTGAVYEATASGGDVTNAGGQEFNVLPGENGYNIKDFGGDPTGTVDCAPIFAKALAACYAAGGGKVFFPDGRWLHNSQTEIDYTFTDAATNGIEIEFESVKAIIVNNNAVGWFKWHQTASRTIRGRINGMNVEMAYPGNNGDIVDIKQLEGGLRRQSAFEVNFAKIYPAAASIADNFYNRGLGLRGLFWPKVQDSEIANPFGPGVSTADQHRGYAGIDFDESYGPEAFRNKIWGGSWGIRHEVLAAPGGEGCNFRDNVCDSDIGIYCYSEGTEPGGWIVGNHTNCPNRGIVIQKKKLMTLSDNLCYNTDTLAMVDIDLIDCEDMKVNDNIFHFDGNTLRTHISIDADCKRITAGGNQHRSDGTAYILAMGAEDVRIIYPEFESQLDTRIVNNGVVRLVVKHLDTLEARVGLLAAQTIPDAVDTPVVWTEEQLDNGGFFTASSDIVRIPANMGITRVEVIAQGKWGNNSVGSRTIRVTKNGALVDGLGVADLPANGLSRAQSVGVIDVADLDAIRLIVFQNSGAPQTFGPDSAWLYVRAI